MKSVNEEIEFTRFSCAHSHLSSYRDHTGQPLSSTDFHNLFRMQGIALADVRPNLIFVQPGIYIVILLTGHPLLSDNSK